MTDLAIPEEYEHGFIEMLQLSEDQAREIVSALKDAPPMRNYTDLQGRVEERVSPDLRSRLGPILETLASLYGLRDGLGLDMSDFVEAASEMVDESFVEGLEFTDEAHRERFKANLAELLGVDSLAIAVRATDILYERERTIHGVPRVFTDIRPVFGADPESGVRGAVIVHTLKVRYHDGRRVRDLFIGLDTENINELMGVLERANSKAEALKQFLDSKGVPYIDAK
jgi:hypothetical protein